MLNRTEKEAIVDSLKTDFEAAKGVFLTNLIGIASNDAVAIRKSIREANGKVVITRNTLLARAAVGTSAENIISNLKGPNAIAFAFDDAAAVAKCLKEAGKEHELVEFKGGVLDGKELSIAQLNELADLPSRDEMLGTLLATFMAPIATFARIANAIKDECETQGVDNPAGLKVEAAV